MADRDLAAEMARPKYAHTEYERRWLVDTATRPPLAGLEYLLIEDRYLDGTRLRLRHMHKPGSAWASYKLTKKYECADPSARPIVTAYLTAEEYALFRALPGCDIAKRRYRLPIGGHVWSLDLFEGPLAGLELVESEACDDGTLASLAPPHWATTEVTGDPRHQCGSLARANAIPEQKWSYSR